LGRQVMVSMLEFYDEETLENWESRVVVRFPKQLAPIKFAIFPLVKKDTQQVEMAENIFKKLSKEYKCEYDDWWAIGKRYRRQDEIGTPYCITVDHQSIEDWTVTIRDRDSMEQKRIKADEINF
jgi:glycyl-tRNA synthetase